jgi:Ca2+-binding RTX toxin-like protein
LTVNGSSGNDFFIGSKGSQTITGGSGDDTLLGDEFEVAMHYGWTYSIASDLLTINDVAAAFVASSEFSSGIGLLSNTNFVNHLYLNALGRQADSGGLNHWVNTFNNGASKESVVLGFALSGEAKVIYDDTAIDFAESNSASDQGDEAYRAYQALLDRAADKDGLIYWANELADGASIESIASGFIASVEFQNLNGGQTNEQFATLLYNNALGRAPDTARLAHWLTVLDNGMTKAQVAVGFIQSIEMLNFTDSTYYSWVKSQGIDDTISGGYDTDKLAGGLLADKFIFNQSEYGHDTVSDFEPWDQIEFQYFGFTQASDVNAYLQQVGDNVVFDYSSDVSITFLNTELTDFSDDSFTFYL